MQPSCTLCWVPTYVVLLAAGRIPDNGQIEHFSLHADRGSEVA